MKKIIVSLCLSTLLFGSSDPQAIVNEVTKLRKKYEECKAGQGIVKGIDPKVHHETLKRIETLSREITQKQNIIRSMEKSLSIRDQSYREVVARNKSLLQQIHSDKVSRQERESLKKAVMDAKQELVLAQKELKGGSASVGQMRQELRDAKAKIASLESTLQNGKKVNTPLPIQPDRQVSALQAQLRSANSTIAALKQKLAENEKHPNVVTKVVEPTEKLKVLQTQLAQAQATIANLQSAKSGTKTVIQEKVVYKDRPVEKIVEKVVYKDRFVPTEKIVTKVVEPTEKLKALQKELASAQATIANLKSASATKAVVKEKIVEKIVYKDRPVEKVVEKVVYKDRPVIQEKVVEKVVYKERSTPPVVKATTKKAVDEATQRRIDKLALELERAKSASKSAVTTAKTQSEMKPSEPAPKKSGGSSSAYRMSVNGAIYNAPYGRQVDTWEARRSFTAGNPSNGWVHITGYFVNRVWQPTQEGENLYVKESDVIRR